LAQSSGADAIDEFLRVRQLDVHVEVHRHESAFVLGLAPLQSNYDIFINSAERWLAVARAVADGARGGGRVCSVFATYKLCSSGLGLKGATACRLSALRAAMHGREGGFTYSHVCGWMRRGVLFACVRVAAWPVAAMDGRQSHGVGEKFPKAPAGGERAAPPSLTAGVERVDAQSESASELHSTFTMVLALALTAELNGVTDLRPQDTEDAPFFYTFKVQCTSCRETHPNFVSVSRFEQNEMSGSRGEANFVWKCKNCKVALPVHPRRRRTP
jgi:hypothetical protein